MLEYKILTKEDIDNIDELDIIRTKSFNLKEQSNYYLDNLKSGKMVGIELLLDNIIIGGAYVYVSPNTYSLVIERIFIIEEYRHNKYASKLLEYILNNKNYFEEYYDIEINSSRVEPSNDELIKFYKENGYKGPNILNEMIRHLDYSITSHK